MAGWSARRDASALRELRSGLQPVISRCPSKQAEIVTLLVTIFASCCGSTAHAEPVIGQFELKTLDSDPGALEFQSQNAWSWGQPTRQAANDGTNQLVFDENAVIRQRHALEIEAGITSRLKMRVGIEFEKERFEDPETIESAGAFDELQLTEAGLELIAVLVPRNDDGAGFGIVVEYERPVHDDEPDTLVVGSIVEFLYGRWFAAVVPMAARTLGSRDDMDDPVDDKWDFAYAAQLAYMFSERWSLAFESYGTIERVAGSGHPSESAQLFGDFDQHRAGPVLYHSYRDMEVGIGLLAGLNHHTPEQTLKLSIEIDF